MLYFFGFCFGICAMVLAVEGSYWSILLVVGFLLCFHLATNRELE